MQREDVWEIERALWLEGVDAYARHLAEEVLLVLPAPVGILDRAQTLASIEQAPRWVSVEFFEQNAVAPAANLRVIAYEAVASRDSPSSTYRALCSSIYVRSAGGWKLSAHQQSAVDT